MYKCKHDIFKQTILKSPPLAVLCLPTASRAAVVLGSLLQRLDLPLLQLEALGEVLCHLSLFLQLEHHSLELLLESVLITLCLKTKKQTF